MKNHPIVIFTFLFWSVTNISLATPLNIDLGVTKTNTELISVKQVKQQLLNNIWFKKSSKMLFSKTGVVSIVNNSKVQSRAWQIEEHDRVVYLKMTTSTCGELVYRIEKNGSTLRWIDEKTNLKIKIDSTPLEKTNAFIKVHNNLVGTWSSSIYPSTVIEDLSGEEGRSIISADFKYFLRADGTFTKSISINREKQSTINGLWQLSEDGQKLILHLQKKNCTYETVVADIKLITMDELVLGQALANTDLEKKLCSQKKTFFYNKQ